MRKRGAYFQLWTKCRGWSQSKPAENAARKDIEYELKHTESKCILKWSTPNMKPHGETTMLARLHMSYLYEKSSILRVGLCAGSLNDPPLGLTRSLCWPWTWDPGAGGSLWPGRSPGRCTAPPGMLWSPWGSEGEHDEETEEGQI